MDKPWRKEILVPSGINTLYSPARVSTMVNLFGAPEGKLTDKCGGKDKVSKKIRDRIVTRSLGPFKSVTGYDRFLDVMSEVFAIYRDKHPEQYADLHQAGCLCVRLVRGSLRQPSNHSWGMAIDLGFGGKVDDRGDGYCFAGLLDLYAIYKKFGIYWGAGFGREDAMHAEASDQLARAFAAGRSFI